MFMLSTALMAAAIIARFSYACIITLCFSTGCLLFLLATKREFRKSSGILLFAFFILFFIVRGQIDMNHVYGELKHVRNIEGEIIKRKLLWMDSAGIISIFPLTGTGFGSFKNIYPAYTSIPFAVQNRGQEITHAHNDYVELMTDGGVIAFLQIAWFVIVVLLRSFLAYRSRKELFCICLFLGCITAFGAVSLFSLAESNLHLGTNGLYFFLLCGLTISASHTRLRRHLKPTKLDRSKFPVRKRLAVPALSTLAAYLVFNACLIFNG